MAVLLRKLSVLLAVIVAAIVAVLGIPVAAVAAPAPPGTVTSSNELPSELWIRGTGRAYRVTYTTTDHYGAPAESTGAVYLPPGPAPVGGWPVVSYAHGTVGLADECAPSATGLFSPERDYLAGWLGRGYAVVASDYLGLGTPGVLPYLDGAAAAHSVIDMVRAARAIDAGLARTWVVIGLSQGGHAALFTAHSAVAYAPELDYRGAVALGAPSQLESLFPVGGPGFPDPGIRGLTGYTVFTVAGLRQVRPDLHIDQYLTPLGLDLAAKADQLCSVEFNQQIKGITVGQIFSHSLNNAEMQRALADYLGVPTSGYTRPVFLGQGVVDQVVPIPLTLALAGQLAAAGTELTFRTYLGAGHVETLAASFGDSAQFVDLLLR